MNSHFLKTHAAGTLLLLSVVGCGGESSAPASATAAPTPAPLADIAPTPIPTATTVAEPTPAGPEAAGAPLPSVSQGPIQAAVSESAHLEPEISPAALVAPEPSNGALAAVDGDAAPAPVVAAAPAAFKSAAAAPAAAQGNFGLSGEAGFYTIDTGAGLVFKIRRTDNGVSTQSAGDIASMVYKGVQYQDPSRGSQLNSGFDFLYKGVSAVDVSARQVDADHIKVEVRSKGLTHYYMAQRGEPRIYMATHFTAEPDTMNLARFIVRTPISALPYGDARSDLRGINKTIESGDVFARPDLETRSKHYSNQRLKDWSRIGATSKVAGLWIVRDNNEGNSGGPFYRSLLNQGTDTNQEITYIINYGEAQTEPMRTKVLNSYTMVFTDGVAPGAIDTSWFAGMGLTGYVGPQGRGRVTGVGLSGRVDGVEYTVGFASPRAQYWATPGGSNGYFDSRAMLPDTYKMTVYKNELAVDTREVVVKAGAVTALHTITIQGDPGADAALWRIGTWDGTPREFLNGDKVTNMHPSDKRMANWAVAPFVIGTSTAAKGFPAYQWKSVNGALTVRFKLTAAQIAPLTMRIGITAAHAGGRPRVQINNWNGAIIAASRQPATRTLTVGTYRGNNALYSWPVPVNALKVGENVMTISTVSGSSGTTFLSPGYAFDALDLVKTVK